MRAGHARPACRRRALALHEICQQQNRRHRQRLQRRHTGERQRDAGDPEPASEKRRGADQQQRQRGRFRAGQRVGIDLHNGRRRDQQRAPERLRSEARRQCVRGEADSQREQQVEAMEKENREMAAQQPCHGQNVRVQRRMRMARRIHQTAREDELEVERRQRLLENVGREIQVVDFVALHRLPQKGRVQQQGESGQQQQVAREAFSGEVVEKVCEPLINTDEQG